MTEYTFGTRVLVRAEVVRVIAEPHDDTHRFRQAASGGRWAGRFESHDFAVGDAWPGEGIDEHWVDAPRGYHVTPALNGRVMARVRRFVLDEPQVGLVIGVTHRKEGLIATVDGATQLYPPLRAIPLLEVALRTESFARIILAHRNDAGLIPAGTLV